METGNTVVVAGVVICPIIHGMELLSFEGAVHRGVGEYTPEEAAATSDLYVIRWMN